MQVSNNQRTERTRKTVHGYTEQKLYRLRKMNRLSQHRRAAT